MKKSTLLIALLAAPVAFAEPTNATTMDLDTSDSAASMSFGANSNERFDNRDVRTNSMSTPARVGMENSVLEADVTRQDTNSESLVGSSTFESASAPPAHGTTGSGYTSNTYNTTETLDESAVNTAASDDTGVETDNNRLSGSSTDTIGISAPTTGRTLSGSSSTGTTATGSTGTATGATTGTTTDAAATGAAAGAATGAAVGAGSEGSVDTGKKSNKAGAKNKKKRPSETESRSGTGSSATGAPTSGSGTATGSGAATGAAAGAGASSGTNTGGSSSSTGTGAKESAQPGESTRTGASTHNVPNSVAGSESETPDKTNFIATDSYRRSGNADMTAGNAGSKDSQSNLSGSATSDKSGANASQNANIAASSGAGTTAATGATAQDTARNQNETELVRQIRSEISNNKELSMTAHNVKITNQNGQIYLKGPVSNASEKSKVEEIAKKMAGNTTVINQTYVEKK